MAPSTRQQVVTVILFKSKSFVTDQCPETNSCWPNLWLAKETAIYNSPLWWCQSASYMLHVYAAARR